MTKITRNPFNPKYFLTVGEWMARVWSEDIKDSAIICMKVNINYIKVRCVFSMVVVWLLPHAEFGLNNHREDVHHFNNKN